MYTLVKDQYLPTDIDMLVQQVQRDNDVYATAPGSSVTAGSCTCSACSGTCYGNTQCGCNGTSDGCHIPY